MREDLQILWDRLWNEFHRNPYSQKTQRLQWLLWFLRKKIAPQNQPLILSLFLERFDAEVDQPSRIMRDSAPIERFPEFDEMPNEKYELLFDQLVPGTVKLLEEIIEMGLSSIEASKKLLEFLAGLNSDAKRAVALILITRSLFCPYVWDIVPFHPRRNGFMDDVRTYLRSEMSGRVFDGEKHLDFILCPDNPAITERMSSLNLIKALVRGLDDKIIRLPDIIDTMLSLILKTPPDLTDEEQVDYQRAILASFTHAIRHNPCSCLEKQNDFGQSIKAGQRIFSTKINGNKLN